MNRLRASPEGAPTSTPNGRGDLTRTGSGKKSRNGRQKIVEYQGVVTPSHGP